MSLLHALNYSGEVGTPPKSALKRRSINREGDSVAANLPPAKLINDLFEFREVNYETKPPNLYYVPEYNDTFTAVDFEKFVSV